MKLIPLLLLLCGCVVPQNFQRVSAWEVHCILPKARIFIPYRDPDYFYMTDSELSKIPLFHANKTSTYDCDEIAFKTFVHMMDTHKTLDLPLCFGVVYVVVGPNKKEFFKEFNSTEDDQHALNFFVTSSHEVFIYEPQTGKVLLLKEALKSGVIKEVILFLL